MRRTSRTRAALGTASLLSALLCACEPGPSPERAAGSAVVARVDGDPILARELDEPLRLRLYDLEEAIYELRRERLAQLLAERPDAQRVDVLLASPERPRLEVGAGDLPVRGAADAAVSLVVFCDFASVHCARIQPALRRLLSDHAGLVSVAHRDHPLPFHRHARAAAEAARCAGEQRDGGFWAYHDALYLEPERLERARLTSLARTLDLDVAAFLDCLDSGRMGPRVDADLRAARALGLRSAPVSFVNGLYLKGPAAAEAFRTLVRDELVRQGVAPPAVAGSPRGELSLELVGTVVERDPRRSQAAFESGTWQATRIFRLGEEVVEGVTLARVESRRVFLRHTDGTTEVLHLSRGPADGHAPEPPLRIEGQEPGGLLRLSRDAVDRALEDRERLEKRLAPGRLDVEGHRLLKLGEIEPGGLYEALGLLPGDVVMQVDGVFVHDGYNPLWETLRTRSQLTVTVMRGGFPKTFAYAIE